MGMQTDVKSVTLTESGTAVAGRTRVKAVVVTATATAGGVALRDGGSGGADLFVINTPAEATIHNILLPGEGILFSAGVYVLVDGVSSVAVVYG